MLSVCVRPVGSPLAHLGSQEKCIDISLAVEMMHYAAVPGAYDIAVLISGDKDFMPAMARIRQARVLV